MTNLCRFKQIKDRVYCWDKYRKTFHRVNLSPLNNSEELTEVITAYMEENEPGREGENYVG